MVETIVSSMNLSPFDLQIDYEDGSAEKITALTTAQIGQIEQRRVKRIKFDASYEARPALEECIHIRNVSPIEYLNQVIHNSVYKKILAFDNYLMINEEHLELMNANWRRKPFMYYMMACLFAGSILVDGNEGLLLNGVESYCRHSSVDAHYENVSQQSSLPDFSSQYPNQLKIVNPSYDNSKKLVIGTNSCNISVVSNIRIDNSKIPLEVGPTTSYFNPSKETRVLLSKKSIERATELFNDQLLPMSLNNIAHMRQLRSKFNQKSTYSMARAFSNFTLNCTLQPFTIYTLVDSTSKAENDAVLGSRIMELVTSTIQEDPQNKLQKKDIELLVPEKAPSKPTSVQKHLGNIVKLFDGDTIEIIGNKSLNTDLTVIADVTSTKLKDANKEIIENIWRKFMRT